MALTPNDYMAINNVGDAKNFIVAYLKEGHGRIGQSYDFDINILGIAQYVQPYAIQAFRANPNLAHSANSRVEEIGAMLQDAAWQMALDGNLRPGPSDPFGQGIDQGYGNGYSLTEKGKQALANGTI